MVSSNTILPLPRDAIGTVVSFLSVGDRARSRRVCRQWKRNFHDKQERRLVEEEWETVCSRFDGKYAARQKQRKILLAQQNHQQEQRHPLDEELEKAVCGFAEELNTASSPPSRPSLPEKGPLRTQLRRIIDLLDAGAADVTFLVEPLTPYDMRDNLADYCDLILGRTSVRYSEQELWFELLEEMAASACETWQFQCLLDDDRVSRIVAHWAFSPYSNERALTCRVTDLPFDRHWKAFQTICLMIRAASHNSVLDRLRPDFVVSLHQLAQDAVLEPPPYRRQSAAPWQPRLRFLLQQLVRLVLLLPGRKSLAVTNTALEFWIGLQPPSVGLLLSVDFEEADRGNALAFLSQLDWKSLTNQLWATPHSQRLFRDKLIRDRPFRLAAMKHAWGDLVRRKDRTVLIHIFCRLEPRAVLRPSAEGLSDLQRWLGLLRTKAVKGRKERLISELEEIHKSHVQRVSIHNALIHYK